MPIHVVSTYEMVTIAITHALMERGGEQTTATAATAVAVYPSTISIRARSETAVAGRHERQHGARDDTNSNQVFAISDQ
jgi:hypothetical protein